MNGIISDIQRFSLHDGPGIRTTVYLKGCNMKCSWCHNPESIGLRPEIAFYKEKCVQCNACYDACPTHAISCKNGIRHYDKLACKHCGLCVELCPAGALFLAGKKMTVEEVFAVIKTDIPYYMSSDGGITLSGGEPLMQAEFAEKLLKKCRENNIDTAMESNLSLPFETLERLLPYLNRIYCDIKTMNDAVHIKTTGVSNRTVLKNIIKLAHYNIPLVIRTPLIPGITDSDENIRETSKWIKENASAEYYELLNYNPFAEMKYENIGLEYELKGKKPLSKKRVKELLNIACQQGIKAVSG